MANTMFIYITRMHSSSMRTARNSSRMPEGMPGSGGVPGPEGGLLRGGGFALRGGIPPCT